MTRYLCHPSPGQVWLATTHVFSTDVDCRRRVWAVRPPSLHVASRRGSALIEALALTYLSPRGVVGEIGRRNPAGAGDIGGYWVLVKADARNGIFIWILCGMRLAQGSAGLFRWGGGGVRRYYLEGPPSIIR